MSFRHRLILGAIVYFCLILLIGFLAFSAVESLNKDIGLLMDTEQDYRACQALNLLVLDVSASAGRWGRQGLPRERRLGFEALGKLRREIRREPPPFRRNLSESMAKFLAETLEDLDREATAILAADEPRKAPYMEARLNRLIELGEAAREQFSYWFDALENRRGEVLAHGYTSRSRIPWILSSLVLAALVLTGAFIWMAVKSLSLPLERLVRGADRVASGDLAHRINLHRTDEFGLLAERFDLMAGKVESSHGTLQRKLDETALLVEVSRTAATSLDLQRLMETMARTVGQRLGFEGFSVYLRKTSGEPRLFVSWGARDERMADKERALVAVAISENQADASKGRIPGEGEGRESADGSPWGIALPLMRGDTCLGALAVRRKDQQDFSEDERNMLGMMANTIAASIANAELYGKTRRQLERTRTIYEFGKTISSTLDLDQLLPYFCRETARILSGSTCIVRFLEGMNLVIKASHGIPEDAEFPPAMNVGEGIVGTVAETGRPAVRSADGEDGILLSPWGEARSLIAVPLKYRDRIIGTIGLYDKTVEGRNEPFDEDDLDTLEAIASVASIAIENARLYNDERRREERLLIAHRRLETLFETVQGGILTVDRELRIRAANRFVQDWTGVGVEALVGRTCGEGLSLGQQFCPVDLVKTTFDTGERQIIALRVEREGKPVYFEVTTYPVFEPGGEVGEVVIFVQDVSERMRFQEEIYGLYTEVAQTKQYLESLITNSADAIITTDAQGVITSWNQGAERIYGYREEEVLGEMFPMVPDFLLPAEKNHTERILSKETIRDLETLRRRKDGQLIEVSLTLSPIMDSEGTVIGISGISRDISDRKRVEQELTRRNQELSRLLFISNAMRSTLNLERLLRMTLTSVTMSDGLGFNRAMLFLVNEERGVIQGAIGVGPGSLEEAWQIWGRMSLERKTLEEMMSEMESGSMGGESFLDRLAGNITVSVSDEHSILARALREREPINVSDARSDPTVDPILVQQLGTEAFVLIPLVARDKAIGILWADNLFNRRPVTDDDVRFLSGFANQVASAIENARLFEKVSTAEAELENIFESISDMVYFNDPDFTIRRVNQAVLERIGRPAEEIVGKKCYEIFHGLDHPWDQCPHTRTLKSGESYVEEIHDPHMGGTFVISSSPIFDSSGEISGTVHVSRDVTESHRLRKRLAKAEKMAALGEMAAKIAHEIRNPLISVGGFARRLEKKLEPPAKDYATIIVDSVNHLEVILKELLGFVKETRIVPIKADLREILDGIIALFNPTFKERGIGIVREYPESPLEVPVDSNKMREAFTNILTNAEQAMERPGKILVRMWSVDDETAVVEISDEGPGMSGTVLQHLFDPFYTTKMTGTGLGLAITQKIVELHKGKIEVTSRLGEGSTFRIFLPMKEVPDEDIGG